MGDMCNPCNPCRPKCCPTDCCDNGIFGGGIWIWIIIAIIIICVISDNNSGFNGCC